MTPKNSNNPYVQRRWERLCADNWVTHNDETLPAGYSIDSRTRSEDALWHSFSTQQKNNIEQSVRAYAWVRYKYLETEGSEVRFASVKYPLHKVAFLADHRLECCPHDSQNHLVLHCGTGQVRGLTPAVVEWLIGLEDKDQKTILESLATLMRGE